MRSHLLVLALTVTIAACFPKPDDQDTRGSTTSAIEFPDFKTCHDEQFASYLDTCNGNADCGGVMECDLQHEFSTSPHCRAPKCEDDTDCAAQFVTLCAGTNFHYECRASNDRVPKECRLVEGAAS